MRALSHNTTVALSHVITVTRQQKALYEEKDTCMRVLSLVGGLSKFS
jgi:hypothetical protein